MFGYIRIDKPELRVREYEAYRAAYCGLCRSMGKCTGCASRLTLSYDFAFLLVFRMMLTGEKPETVYARCPVHPFKKRMMLETNRESEYVSCAAALLLYYKCLDDLSDERGGKRLRARMLLPSVGRMKKRAIKRFPALSALDREIERLTKEITEAEKEEVRSVDRYAALSGEMLQEIFSFGLPEKTARIARSVGYHVGKWIYLVDAYDDLEEDRKKGRFNPLLLLWEEDGIKVNAEDARESVRTALLSELLDVERAIDLLDFYDNGDFPGVLRNILYLGMPKAAEAVLTNEKKRGEKPSRRKED